MDLRGNMQKKTLLAACLAATSLYSLEETPWLNTLYQFNLLADATYSKYRYVDEALVQPTHTYNNYLTSLGFGFTPSPSFGMELEVELARTPYQNYGFRSAAVGARYLVLDGIAGDPFSLVVGGNLRPVRSRSVRDISSPYGSYMNYEAMISIGKELLAKEQWLLRGYLVGTVGIANRGSFWDRFSAVLEGRFLPSQVLKLFAHGYFGYGSNKIVDIENFRGWGEMNHSSIDIGMEYRYSTPLWGELGLSYAHRVLAKSYPENEQTFTLSYKLPFSLF